MEKFTWVETYKEITRFLIDKENKQKYLIELLKKIGVDGFKDVDKNNEDFELDEIDPFSFFAYLNKYKKDEKRIEILQNIHKELNFHCTIPIDVAGIPTSHPLKVRLFPYKIQRNNNEIALLWKLFKQVCEQNIDNNLFKRVLEIRGVGKNKLSIVFFYCDPDYYLSLDSVTIDYLRKQELKYSYNDIKEYLKIKEVSQARLHKKPFEISYTAWEKRYNIEIVNSVETLLSKLTELNQGFYDNVEFYYRGHSSTKYKLEPSIYRNGYIKRENLFFKDIISRCPNDFVECETTFEKLVKMQHYSMPTRLLDITSNPLVALYFACKNSSEEEENEDGCFYRFEIKESEIKYYDSDSISVVSNISRRPIEFSIESIKKKKKELFNKEEPILFLLHEIRSEKPHFNDCIEAKDIESVFFVKPKLDNPRIIRQEGAFFIFGIENEKKNPAKFNEIVYTSFTIKKSDKKEILNHLDLLGINESTLFPEIEHVAKHIKEKR